MELAECIYGKTTETAQEIFAKITFFFNRYEAYQFMDISHFLGRSGVTCLVPSPHRLISWTLLLRPFQSALWLGVMMCLLLECLALCVTRRLESSSVPGSHTWFGSLIFGCISTLKLCQSEHELCDQFLFP